MSRGGPSPEYRAAGKGSIDLEPAKKPVHRRDRQSDDVRPRSFNPVDETGPTSLDRVATRFAVGLPRPDVPRDFGVTEWQEMDPRRHQLRLLSFAPPHHDR